LFPDYSRDYPLRLSQERAEDLAGWQAFFEEHADPFEGWDTDANLQKWLRDGDWLADRLQDEVQAFADVKREFGSHRP
jgi:hypothetical protein